MSETPLNSRQNKDSGDFHSGEKNADTLLLQQSILYLLEYLGVKEAILTRNPLLRSAEAAEYLQIDVPTVQALIKSGLLPAKKLHGGKNSHWRIYLSDLENLAIALEKTRGKAQAAETAQTT